jgi:hypothetical protein
MGRLMPWAAQELYKSAWKHHLQAGNVAVIFTTHRPQCSDRSYNLRSQ